MVNPESVARQIDSFPQSPLGAEFGGMRHMPSTMHATCGQASLSDVLAFWRLVWHTPLQSVPSWLTFVSEWLCPTIPVFPATLANRLACS